MGKMKELSQNFIGYTIDADVYFNENKEAEQAKDFISPNNLSADGIKSVINRVVNKHQRVAPREATLYIYKTYELYDIKYSQLTKTFKMSQNQCKESWT